MEERQLRERERSKSSALYAKVITSPTLTKSKREGDRKSDGVLDKRR